MQTPRVPSMRRITVPLIAVAFVLVHCIRHRSTTGISFSLKDVGSARKEELLRVYEFPPSFAEEPAHLTPIDPSTLIMAGSQPIDVAHRNAYLHTGSVLFVMDASGLILVLQRSKDVVTCPSTWSVLGEHSIAGEAAIETVVRGIEEELGLVSVGVEQSYAHPGIWAAEFHSNNHEKHSLNVTIQNATELPLYYIRHYGPRNDNRVDSQLTYLWLVKFPKRHTEIEWQLDDEVAAHKWIRLAKFRSWMSDDAQKDSKKYSFVRNKGGVSDDGPDEGDFCHRTIRSLYEVGLAAML
ncbi:hypothetical protein ACHAWF_002800 [Thalassiosira exigua]